MSEQQTIETTTAIAIIPASVLPTILGADTNDILGQLRKELAGYTPDATTPSGRDTIGAKAKRVGVAKQDLLRLAATLKADHQKVIKSVNAEERVIEEHMDAMRDAILAPRVAYQEREKTRVAAHEVALKAMADLFLTLPAEATAADIVERLKMLRPCADRAWEEFEDRASREFASTKDCLANALTRARTREAEAAELARLRAEQVERDRLEAIRVQSEREAEIARQAAEAARVAAEAEAERLRAEAAAKVERERLAAEAEAARMLREAEDRAAAERARIEREAREAEEAAARKLAEAERAAQRRDYARRMVQHITNCGLGFIDNQAQPYGILLRELDEKIAYDADTFGDLLDEALAARATATDRLKAGMEAARKRREAEERADRERREAEAREAAQAARAEAAERQAEAVQHQAARDAEAAVERERQRVAAEAEATRKAEVAREADKQHKATINREAMADLVAAGLDDKAARAAVTAIAQNKVKHVRISY